MIAALSVAPFSNWRDCRIVHRLFAIQVIHQLVLICRGFKKFEDVLIFRSKHVCRYFWITAYFASHDVSLLLAWFVAFISVERRPIVSDSYLGWMVSVYNGAVLRVLCGKKWLATALVAPDTALVAPDTALVAPDAALPLTHSSQQFHTPGALIHHFEYFLLWIEIGYNK